LKLEIIIVSLSGCSGCISSIISLDIFPQFVEKTKIIYFPFISDEEKILDCDIALIEGCISIPSQVERIKEIRKKAKNVYALGSCSAFGGILSLSRKKNAEPISNYIEIDGIIPGCPPPPNLLGNCLIRLVERKNIILSEKNMCAACPLKGDIGAIDNIEINSLNPNLDEITFPEENSECFLKRGILCLGPITRDICEHICIKNGLPCEGCAGPIFRDFTSNAVNFLSLVNLSKNLKKYRGIFYRFSNPKFGREYK